MITVWFLIFFTSTSTAQIGPFETHAECEAAGRQVRTVHGAKAWSATTCIKGAWK